MFAYGLPAPVGLGPRFEALILGLCRSLGYPVDREQAPLPLMEQTFRALLRRRNRFLALLARFHAGTLPKFRIRCLARSERAAPDIAVPERAPPPPSQRALVVEPRDRGWLVRMVGYRAATYTEHLEHVLAIPEMAEFLAAAPQAARLLRPLWRMLNPQPLPELLRVSSRSRPTSPPAAAPAMPEPGPVPTPDLPTSDLPTPDLPDARLAGLAPCSACEGACPSQSGPDPLNRA